MDLVAWTDAEKQAFLRQQFAAQQAYYHAHYTDTTFELILLDGEPVGRLYVARWPREIRIVDISLLPTHRGGGAGTLLLRALQAEAAEAGKRLTIHVERLNPARRLYDRLGFRLQQDGGVYLLLEWSPEA
jgi:GNAT superfamily N-acetyltransferase